MYELYMALGVVVTILCYVLYKPLLKLVKGIKIGRYKELQKEVNNLKKEIGQLKEDMSYLYKVTNETQKTNELLFPQNFDKTKEEGATVFVKDGEEKKYETIDWRSR